MFISKYQWEWIFVGFLIGFTTSYLFYTQIEPQMMAGILLSFLGAASAWYALIWKYTEKQTHRSMLEILHLEEILSYLTEVDSRLKNQIDAISKRHDFNGIFGLNISYDNLKEPVEKSIKEDLHNYETNVSQETYNLYFRAVDTINSIWKHETTTYFRETAKVFKAKASCELWEKIQGKGIPGLMACGELIDMDWLKKNEPDISALIIQSLAAEDDYLVFFSSLNNAVNGQEQVIKFRSQLKNHVEYGDNIIVKIESQKDIIEHLLEVIKKRVHPRELDEFRESRKKEPVIKFN